MDEIRLDWQMFNMTATTATVARQAHTHTPTKKWKYWVCTQRKRHTHSQFTLDPFVCSSIQSISERTHTHFFVIYMLILMIIPWPNKEEKERMWWLALLLLFHSFFLSFFISKPKWFGWMETNMGNGTTKKASCSWNNHKNEKYLFN